MIICHLTLAFMCIYFSFEISLCILTGKTVTNSLWKDVNHVNSNVIQILQNSEEWKTDIVLIISFRSKWNCFWTAEPISTKRKLERWYSLTRSPYFVVKTQIFRWFPKIFIIWLDRINNWKFFMDLRSRPVKLTIQEFWSFSSLHF